MSRAETVTVATNEIERLTSQAAKHQIEAEQLRTRVTALETERKRLIGVGTRMSNLCFNLKQSSFTFEEHMREGCGRLQRDWDRALRERGDSDAPE